MRTAIIPQQIAMVPNHSRGGHILQSRIMGTGHRIYGVRPQLADPEKKGVAHIGEVEGGVHPVEENPRRVASQDVLGEVLQPHVPEIDSVQIYARKFNASIRGHTNEHTHTNRGICSK